MKKIQKPKARKFKGLNPSFDIIDAVALVAGRNKTRKAAVWAELVAVGLLIFIAGIMIGVLFGIPEFDIKNTIEYVELQEQYNDMIKQNHEKWVEVCETYGDFICIGEPIYSLIEADILEFAVPETGLI